ncbi:uncharacterized protein BO96DRAFT_408259 [Aspergillus niger CBS 101883]|uniref:Uncharacterized protein n=1 Tax=Aspergillus niger ATCC 13496 TaxID=1353008 RepID=A0A370C6U6_ASPNG|nr:uncharacterized protein BO96DRAFT_408259 [Aspergillus niger CBS 101883]PYH61451.1 hypothetical protein BO96DRAFT_408259 [Aspergillus niger CBS 101883]RDH21613.1 hypothetical protein M747DRAFT_21479 [Aspergillus niger ATCC 13496]
MALPANIIISRCPPQHLIHVSLLLPAFFLGLHIVTPPRQKSLILPWLQVTALERRQKEDATNATIIPPMRSLIDRAYIRPLI